MKPILRSIIIALISLLVSSAMVLAAGETRAMKQLMGENFQNIHKILNDLIISNYAPVPEAVGVIRSHAEGLTRQPPLAIKVGEERLLFVSYATNLRVAASHLITVTEELIRHDRQGGAGELKVDYLRVVAAQHFGTVVTSCVLCHNQFRRYTVSAASH